MPHIHEKIDFTVSAFIVHNKNVLLIRHRKLKKWLPPGGHIELHQDPEEALFNEIREETSLLKKDLTVLSTKPKIASKGTTFLFTPNFLDIHDISPSHRHVGLVFFLRSRTSKVMLAEREHTAIRWFSRSDLSDRAFKVTPAVRYYALQALDKAKDQTLTLL